MTARMRQTALCRRDGDGGDGGHGAALLLALRSERRLLCNAVRELCG